MASLAFAHEQYEKTEIIDIWPKWQKCNEQHILKFKAKVTHQIWKKLLTELESWIEKQTQQSTARVSSCRPNIDWMTLLLRRTQVQDDHQSSAIVAEHPLCPDFLHKNPQSCVTLTTSWLTSIKQKIDWRVGASFLESEFDWCSCIPTEDTLVIISTDWLLKKVWRSTFKLICQYNFYKCLFFKGGQH